MNTSALLILRLSLLVLLAAPGARAADPMPTRERTAVAVEALKKLQGVDLSQNASLKAAVLRVLAAVRGTPDFVRLIQQFGIRGQDEGLVEIAITHPDESIGVDAVRLVLDQHGTNTLRSALRGADTNAAVRLVQVLGNTRSKQAVSLLQPLLADPQLALPVRRQSVQALALTEEGARALLDDASRDVLPEDLHLSASLALGQSRWPELRATAAKVLPPPLGRDAQPLPPLNELLTRTGDATLGKAVFFRAETGCANCHQINGTGRDVGPNLSEIGGKLGKDALYEAIFNPSAGISFGFEPWTLELASGEEAYGLLVSETADEVAMKDTVGIVSRYPKKDVRARRQMKVSLMPSGLQLTMTTEELVGLVEYLASLKKVKE